MKISAASILCSFNKPGWNEFVEKWERRSVKVQIAITYRSRDHPSFFQNRRREGLSIWARVFRCHLGLKYQAMGKISWGSSYGSWYRYSYCLHQVISKNSMKVAGMNPRPLPGRKRICRSINLCGLSLPSPSFPPSLFSGMGPVVSDLGACQGNPWLQ